FTLRWLSKKCSTSRPINAVRSALRIRRSHQLMGEMFRRSSVALAQSNKSRTGCEATKKRESSVSLQAKRDDKRRASGRSDLPSDDVGLHRRRGGLRRDRVTP